MELAFYYQALRYIGEETPELTEEERIKCDEARLPCRLNKAACLLQLKRYSEAAEECAEVCCLAQTPAMVVLLMACV